MSGPWPSRWGPFGFSFSAAATKLGEQERSGDGASTNKTGFLADTRGRSAPAPVASHLGEAPDNRNRSRLPEGWRHSPLLGSRPNGVGGKRPPIFDRCQRPGSLRCTSRVIRWKPIEEMKAAGTRHERNLGARRKADTGKAAKASPACRALPAFRGRNDAHPLPCRGGAMHPPACRT